MNKNIEICNAFNAHAAEYETAAVVQKEIGQRLFERLDYLKIEPQYILDLGCGSGYFSKLLKKRYPKAHIVGLDLASFMLKEAYAKQSFFKKWSLVRADMMCMPFPTGLFDLVFANQSIHWASSLPVCIREINRVMNVNGCLMFSTLGPDTFCELRQAWALADNHKHTNEFVDMHDVGDMLLAEQFLDPVMDMEMLSVHYKTLPQLLSTLKAQGVRNINAARNSGLTGRKAWQKFNDAMSDLRTDNGRFPLTYELVYGHAWKGVLQKTQQGTEAFIPVSQLRERREVG